MSWIDKLLGTGSGAARPDPGPPGSSRKGIRRPLQVALGMAMLVPVIAIVTFPTWGLGSRKTATVVTRTVQTIQTPAGPKSVVNYTAQPAPQPSAAAEPGCPAPGPGHEYLVVWAGKMNAADITGKDIVSLINGGDVNLEGIKEVLPKETVPGQDAIFTIDAERACSTYGHVVNIALVPGADGIENEPHHMQYIWFPGQSIWAGGLFTSRLFTWDPSALPQLSLVKVDEPFATAGGSIWDAFEALPDGTAYGTLMGGPLANYGLTPGEVVHVGPKGEILGQFSAAAPEGLPLIDPQNLLPSCPDLGSCANPHGIQARPDLDVMATSDYAEPARIILDPTKPENYDVFRRTVRIWDISNENNPTIKKVDVMPKGPRNDANPGHAENLGIMELGKTWDYPMANGKIPRGFFAESMCGGAIYYTSDITDTTAHPWHEVFDSTAAVFSPKGTSVFGSTPGGGSAPGGPNSQVTEAGGCDGGGWVQVSPDNRFLFHAVSGRAPNQDDFADTGTPKMVYSLNVQKLLEAGDNYDCDINRDIRAVKDPVPYGGADCPTVAGVVPVNDTTSGGPHWGSFDNFHLASISITDPQTGRRVTDTHALTRISFADYFVSRTGVDGNHKLYAVDVDPQTGDLSFDNSFISEDTGTPGINFNRSTWPGGAVTGYYKPHSMLFVENKPPLTGVTRNAAGAVTGYWGQEVDGGRDTGGFAYNE